MFFLHHSIFHFTQKMENINQIFSSVRFLQFKYFPQLFIKIKLVNKSEKKFSNLSRTLIVV